MWGYMGEHSVCMAVCVLGSTVSWEWRYFESIADLALIKAVTGFSMIYVHYLQTAKQLHKSNLQMRKLSLGEVKGR